ncbi:MAG TPA: aldo/keto reductase, partial [Polyangiaceae bacterium]|nr:aldo/keto reductase [Polyangiaceae bacterium]
VSAGLPATRPAMNTRPIPKTKELVPMIGLGTWQTFDVARDPALREPVREVLRRFFAAGGRVVDSSPMYGRAEEVTGDLLAELEVERRKAAGESADAQRSPLPFLATKVWTTGRDAGIREMKRSMMRFRTERLDLMQVHNLVDVETHLPVLREWKKAKTIRYLGVTHYQQSEFPRIERLMRNDALDFVQIPYSIARRQAEERLLPTAVDTGTAVLVMQPFETGELFRRVKNKALPDFAKELDCTSFAQFFLKFIVSHPAVTCPLPATSNPKHVSDNVQAGFGRLPDATLRRKMIEFLES